jgi:uncharacterized protein (UPF0335 family)
MSDGTNSTAVAQLRQFVERVERLEEEKKALSDDVRDVYAEAKANGYDPRIMRQVIRLRKMETHKRQEEQAVLETYSRALGLIADDPEAGGSCGFNARGKARNGRQSGREGVTPPCLGWSAK